MRSRSADIFLNVDVVAVIELRGLAREAAECVGDRSSYIAIAALSRWRNASHRVDFVASAAT